MSIKVIDEFEHASGGVVARSANLGHGSRRLADFMPLGVTQEQKNALTAAGVTMSSQLYVIVDAEDYMPEGLNQSQYDALAAAGLLPGGEDG